MTALPRWWWRRFGGDFREWNEKVKANAGGGGDAQRRLEWVEFVGARSGNFGRRE